MQLEKNTKNLIQAIEQRVSQELTSANEKLEQDFKAEIKQYQDKLEEETKLYIQQELADLRLSLIQNESQAKWSLKQDLLESRNNLVNSLLDSVYEELLAFSKSAEYRHYLESKLEKLAELAKQGGELRVGESDLAMAQEWASKQTANIVAVKDDSNVLGGFLFISADKKMEFDHTMEAILAEQKKWFYENSKLVL